MTILLSFVSGYLPGAGSSRNSSTRLILEKRKYRNVLILLLFISCFLSCKKKNETPPNKNEVIATVVVSPASTININAAGSKALMGCSFAGTYVDGTNEANAAVYISYVFGAASTCVTTPGNYAFDCEYRINVTDPNTPIFSNNGANPGSITFTTINDHYMEGSFTAVCRCNSGGCAFGVDSVVVTGSFKGDHLN